MPLTCEPSALKIASACFAEPCLSDTDRRALEILFKIKAVAADGGTDYSADLSQLIQDAACFNCLSEYDRRAIFTYLEHQNALNEDRSFTTTDTSELLSTVKCYRCLPEVTQKAILLYLKCLEVNAEAAE